LRVHENDIKGTLLYMPPEQVNCKRYGQQVDQWALGIIVFKMLTGKHPFYEKHEGEEEYIDKLSSNRIDQLLQQAFEVYDFSEMAVSFLKRLLARNASDRYVIFQCLQHPWITRNFDSPVPLT
jgi:calcium-dependent protein kinase